MSNPSDESVISSARRRAPAIFMVMIGLLLSSFVLGWALYRGLQQLDEPQEDVGWAIYQLGLEHQRLQLAVETDAPYEVTHLRSELYLSRVLLLQNAPAYQAVLQGSLGESIAKLASSAQQTQPLLSGAQNGATREVLLAHVRQDAETVRKLTQDLTSRNRLLQVERRQRDSHRLIYFLTTLEGLFLILLGFATWSFLINRKLRKASNQLSLKSADLDAILNAVEDGVIGVAADDSVVYCSDRAASLMGWGTLPVVGQPIRDLADQGPLNAILVDLLNALKTVTGSDDKELVRRPSTGVAEGIRYFELRGAIASYGWTNTGHNLRIVTISDITSQEAMQRKRDEYDARIGEMSRLLTLATISGGIVHEISQPLSSIKNYVHLLRSPSKAPATARKRYLANLGEEVDRVVETVRNVRRMALDQQVDIGSCDLLEALQNSVRLAAFGKPKEVEVECTVQEPEVRVLGSLPLIGQVLVNLIRNAIDASEQNGSHRVKVDVIKQGSDARVSVRDYGLGVSSSFVDRIFLPFSGQSEGGMGIGLAICKRIVDSLGGDIEWQNLREGGAVFSFTIPLADNVAGNGQEQEHIGGGR